MFVPLDHAGSPGRAIVLLAVAAAGVALFVTWPLSDVGLLIPGVAAAFAGALAVGLYVGYRAGAQDAFEVVAVVEDDGGDDEP